MLASVVVLLKCLFNRGEGKKKPFGLDQESKSEESKIESVMTSARQASHWRVHNQRRAVINFEGFGLEARRAGGATLTRFEKEKPWLRQMKETLCPWCCKA